MSQQMLIQLIRETIQTTLIMGAPLLAAALVVGLVVSIFQVVTSIQDMTLSFVPRIVAVFVLALLIAPWLMEKMIAFTRHLFEQFHLYAR